LFGANTVDLSGVIQVLIALLGGGVLTAIVAFMRYRNTGSAERESIIVESAARAVKVMDQVLRERQEALRAALSRIEELEARITEATRQIESLQAQLRVEKRARAEVQRRLDQALAEREGMSDELAQLRAQVNRLDPDVATNGAVSGSEPASP
jgi:chromosome segregation ATPase